MNNERTSAPFGSPTIPVVATERGRKGRTKTDGSRPARHP